jgi:Flp pilus assembly protein TadD
LPICAFVLSLTTLACGERQTDDGSGAAAGEALLARTNGLTLLQQDRLEEAEAEFTRLVELVPGEAAGYANLALVHVRAGRVDEAEREVRRAFELAPNDPDVALILARVFELGGELDSARITLESSLAAEPQHLRTLYALATHAERHRGEEGAAERRGYLERAVELAPANLAARLELARSLLSVGRADPAIAQLEALRQQAPSFPQAAAESLEEAIDRARGGELAEARTSLSRFGEYFEVTTPFQAAAQELRGPPEEIVGLLGLTFSHEFSLQIQEEEFVLSTLRYTDATSTAALESVPVGPLAAPTGGKGTVVTIGDFDGDDDDDLIVAATRGDGVPSLRLLRDDLGRFVDVTPEAGISPTRPVHGAIFGDYDQDRRLDLLLVSPEGSELYRNTGDGRFEDVTFQAGLGGTDARDAVFVDLDLDGDLDLYLVRTEANRFLRNNGDGSFEERAAAAEIAGDSNGDSRGVVFADFDDDRDVDLFVANAAESDRLYSNARGGLFVDVTEESGLASQGGSAAAAVGDYDNDGAMDLFVAGLSGTHRLYRNQGDGRFERDEAAEQAIARAAGVLARDAEFLDFDNDGHLDLLVAGVPAARDGSGLTLLRNVRDGAFEDGSRFLPGTPGAFESVGVTDYNQDGDLDIVAAGPDGVRLLRNDGANLNHYFRIALQGLGSGSGKNNRFAIGARVEVRAGDLFQARVVSSPITHFGLDGRLKADVVRVEWPNGVAQDLFFPGTDADLIEDQSLKGSCPFLYSWNGERYEFVKDVLWKSALGMPLGIMGASGERSYAPAAASREFLRIPGEQLRAKDEVYSLQLTEELWETVYVDEVRLIAVDHPDSVDVYVDERFVPPGPVSLELFQVARRYTPVAAVDDRGNDQLAAIRQKDDVYVSNLVPGPYQGITELHDLILDLGDLARADEVVLFLNGWVFPTDASINVAMSQSDQLAAVFPVLQALATDGEWRTIEQLSIPSGKDKTIVANLTGKFTGDDRQLRIRTNMQVYWDHIFFTARSRRESDAEEQRARGASDTISEETQLTTLVPTRANLHYRGFSRLYRKGGRYGPHWFDYGDVDTSPRWSDLEGLYTRYGDVRPLLEDADDMYVVLNAGDEITIEFDVSQAPVLGDGWRRDFLLYTDGWIKDGDLNTGTGDRVEPLPFHAQTRYPYGPEESYPDDDAHRRYLEEYQTRRVTADRF